MSFIDIKNISKEFITNDGAITALQETSLQIEDGEFVTVVGPSGCGKTTLLTVLAGLDDPTTGHVSVDGQTVRGPRSDTSIVFQKPVLLPWMSVQQNVLLPVRASRKPNADDQARAKQLLDLVGLSQFASNYPNELSGGMAQRNGLARALMTDPRILLLDEPFAALDALTRERLMVELAQIWETQQKAALFITHNITEAVFLGDRIAVFSPRPGRIIEEVDVPFERPRKIDLLGSSEFAELVGYVRDRLGSMEAQTELNQSQEV